MRQHRDLEIAMRSPLWGQAVAFLRTHLTVDSQRQIREARITDGAAWVTPYHFGWGMAIRNVLRTSGFGEPQFGIENMDHIYVALVEEAVPIDRAGGRVAYDDAKLDDIFSYHAPTGEQPAQYEAIRAAAKVFAKVLVANTPPSADQTAAIRKLRESVMTANAAIALHGQS
jgi:hypothetical protein